ncbi:MAG: OmpA family protein [Myxococcales bacterium]|nr:OmpA family protein [Myxococcales bacterium]
MGWLVACMGCRRHVRVGDAACPFCGSAMPSLSPPLDVPPGLSRAGRLALKLVLGVSAMPAVVGCAPAPPPPEMPDEPRGMTAQPAPEPEPSASGSALPEATPPPTASSPSPRFIAIYGKTEVRLVQVVPFDPSSVVVGEGSEATLQAIVEVTEAYPDMFLVIVGHADVSEGSAETAMKVSRARAEAVKARLVAAGVADERLSVEAMGDGQPLVASSDAAGRATNRRVAFRVTDAKGNDYRAR